MRFLPLLLLLGSCGRPEPSPGVWYANARRLLREGDLKVALLQAEAGLKVEPSWRFRLIKAEILLSSGKAVEALEVLDSASPPENAELSARLAMCRGWARLKLADYPAAGLQLNQALEKARALGLPLLEGEVEVRRGALLVQLGRMASADDILRNALRIASAQGDAYLEAAATGNLGYLSLNAYRYDEAIIWFEQTRAAFARLGSADNIARTLGNLGFCYYRLGEYGQALRYFREAESRFRTIGNRDEQQTNVGNIGNVLHDQGDLQGAAAKYADALRISREIGSQYWTGWWLNNLAVTSIDLGDFDAAERFNREALELKRNLPDRSDFYPRVNEARIAAGRRQHQQAEKLFQALLAEPSDDPTPMLDAESGMAALLVDTNRPAEAEARFRSAIAGIESRRTGLTREEFKLSYLESLIRFYQAYVDFLVTRGDRERALEIAETSRARLLDERVASAAGRPAVSAVALKKLARSSGSLLLAYWLAPGRSFLWVITPDAVKLHQLPPEREIAALVDRYRALIERLRDPLDAEDPAGRKLSEMLLSPVREQIASSARVIVVPDRSLHSLNLETLPDPANPSRFLIEQVTLAVAPALGLLLGGQKVPSTAPSILLMGDADPAAEEYPRLPFAGREIEAIGGQFPPDRRVVLQRERASPESYRAAGPGRFPWIHFAAHASANRESPLDSALILSRGASGYALSAREVMAIPLRAELVTLSACRGAGARTYSGEGAVGLSWAFLRAGARSVIAGLWDVTDLSTSRLMADFYGRLLGGATANDALRQAKLELIRSKTAYRKPFYWGPFELYVGAP